MEEKMPTTTISYVRLGLRNKSENQKIKVSLKAQLFFFCSSVLTAKMVVYQYKLLVNLYST